MARAPTMVIQDDYIDMDLSPSSPQCSLLEFEFHSAGGAGGGVSNSRRREEEAACASPADELFYRGKLLPLHLPPRLQLVQKLLQEQQVHAPEIKPPATVAERGVSVSAGAEAEDGKAGAKRYSWSKRLKLMKRWTSREYIRSLFLAKAGDLGVASGGCGRERAGLLGQDELCSSSHRRSFSGIIRRVRLVVATKSSAASAQPGTSPLCSSSSSSASTPSCGNAERFFLRPRAPMPMPVLKRSSSAGSEEGAIQGAIAHCKRSHQQQLLQQGRKSASGVVFYSVSNTPRISTSVAVAAAAAANESSQERQEMCRG